MARARRSLKTYPSSASAALPHPMNTSTPLPTSTALALDPQFMGNSPHSPHPPVASPVPAPQAPLQVLSVPTATVDIVMMDDLRPPPGLPIDVNDEDTVMGEEEAREVRTHSRQVTRPTKRLRTAVVEVTSGVKTARGGGGGGFGGGLSVIAEVSVATLSKAAPVENNERDDETSNP
ncbi:hypothetical protein DXG01_001934 [Tephrocybe rancida]|nr:hypothetical protein DXG01_001934 [Tephrocybe rancida]